MVVAPTACGVRCWRTGFKASAVFPYRGEANTVSDRFIVLSKLKRLAPGARSFDANGLTFLRRSLLRSKMSKGWWFQRKAPDGLVARSSTDASQTAHILIIHSGIGLLSFIERSQLLMSA
jgi:hypothetical protein